MILEDKSIILTYKSTFTDYDTSVDDDNIGFKIVELIRNNITKAIKDSGNFCSTFNPIYISHFDITDTIKIKFILYSTYKGDLLISLPGKDFTLLHNTIKKYLNILK